MKRNYYELMLQRIQAFCCQHGMSITKSGLLLLVVCFLQFCCKKEKAFANEGVITGIDVRNCPCVAACPCSCGGLIFHFTNSGDTSRVYIDNSIIFNLASNYRFPVRVQLDWLSTARCDMPAIKIIRYKIL